MANYNTYKPLLQQIEGGYQDVASDSGNYNSFGENVGTNYGISARFYEQIIGRPPTVSDMKNITKESASNLFEQYFWNRQRASEIHDQRIANTIIDHHINAGNGVILAQRTLNEMGSSLAVDNQIGNNTLQALNSVAPVAFINAYNQKREQYYIDLNRPEFLKGWLYRLQKFAVDHKKGIAIGSLLLLLALGTTVVYLSNNTKNKEHATAVG